MSRQTKRTKKGKKMKYADLLSHLEGQLEEYENYMKNKTNE